MANNYGMFFQLGAIAFWGMGELKDCLDDRAAQSDSVGAIAFWDMGELKVQVADR